MRGAPPGLHALLAPLVWTLAASCGDPAQPEDYQGEVLAELRCVIAQSAIPLVTTQQVAVGIAWHRPDVVSGALIVRPQAVEDIGNASFAHLRVYEPPDVKTLGLAVASGLIVIGQVVYFEDVDGDDLWDEGEALFGVARDTLVVYTPDGASDPAFAALAPGFHGARPDECPDDRPVHAFAPIDPWTCTIEGVVDPARPFHPYRCPHPH